MGNDALAALDTHLGNVLRAHWGAGTQTAADMVVGAKLRAAQTNTAAPHIPKPAQKSLSDAAGDLREQIANDPGLRAAAVQRKAELEAIANSPGMNGNLAKRCSVSAIHLKALRLALA